MSIDAELQVNNSSGARGRFSGFQTGKFISRLGAKLLDQSSIIGSLAVGYFLGIPIAVTYALVHKGTEYFLRWKHSSEPLSLSAQQSKKPDAPLHHEEPRSKILDQKASQEALAAKKVNSENFSATRIQAAFQDNFFRRVPLATQTHWIREMVKYENEPISPNTVKAFKELDGKDPIFQKQEWEILAVYCYLRGFLDKIELSKLLLYKDCCQVQDFQVHSLKDPNSLEILKRGLDRFCNSDRIYDLAQDQKFKNYCFFSHTETELPTSMQRSVFKDLVRNSRSLFVINATSSHEIELYTGLVIPPDLLYSLANLIFGPSATKPEPVLGYDPDERMAEWKSRIVCIPCPNTGIPDAVHDNLSTSRGGMYVHDTLHIFLDSAISHREVWVDLAKEFSNRPIGVEFDDRVFKGIYFEPFQTRKIKLPESYFWEALYFTLFDPKYCEDHVPVVERTLDRIRIKDWGRKYNITLDSLQRHQHGQYLLLA